MKVIMRAITSDEEILFEVGSVKVSVGRHSSSIVRIKDHHCSHNHCVFWVEGKKLFLEDRDSKNGTFVNGVRVQRNQVFIQDKIKIGNCIISVSSTHNTPDIIKTLDFPGSFDERTTIGIALQTQSNLDLIRLNPRLALDADRRVFGKRITQKIIRPRGYQESLVHANRWHDSWRHWLAMIIDVSLVTCAFCTPFLIMFWLDETLDVDLSLADAIGNPNLAIASVGSILLGALTRQINIHARGGTVGERVAGLATVPGEFRTRKPN